MLAHWDEVPTEMIATDQLSGKRSRLGKAAGAHQVGLSRYEMEPRTRAMPLHVHGDEEECFVVLRGGGVSIEGDRSYDISAGDLVLYPASGLPHTVISGAEGIDLLAFSSGSDTHLSWLPRAGAMWAGPHWIPVDAASPFMREDAAGPIAVPERGPRPRSIVELATLPGDEQRTGEVGRVVRKAGLATGARRSRLSEIRVDPGRLSAPPHCHSAEEELFVVLEGEGALELLCADGESSSFEVRVGHVVSRLPGTGVAHTFRAGAGGLVLLAFSQVEHADICFLPRSSKLHIPALKTTFRVEALDYWDGER